MARKTRPTRPALEPLEDRKLLNARIKLADGSPINDKDLRRFEVQKQNNVPLGDRRFSYVTPQGTRVQVTLYGIGSLAGSKVNPDGSLDLIYDNTGPSSQIVATTHGRGRAALHVLRDADVDPLSASGVGSNEIFSVKMRDFDLVDGGLVNLSGGVGNVFLGSIGSNTQVELRSLQPNTASAAATTTSTQEVLTYITTPTGAVELAGVGGLATVGAVSTTPTTSTTSNVGRAQTPLPNEVNLTVDTIDGAPARPGSPLGHAQIVGYDPTANAVVRFDAVTGDVLGTMPLSSPAALVSGVGLGRAAGRQVVLVGTSGQVQAFDVLTGESRGTFTTSNLAPEGFNRVTGIAGTDARSVIVDAEAGQPGVAQAIDVTASLAAGQAVPVGPPFVPTREFLLTGGATGITGTNLVFFTGAAHFDTFQPNLNQAGILTTSLTNGVITASARTQLSAPPSIVNAGPPFGPPTQALGSIDQSLALVTGVANGKNLVTLYDPRTFAVQTTVALNYPNPLTGLSESFHPELLGTAVINVGGPMHEIRARRVNGLVLNDIGYLGRINIDSASNSTFVGLPVGHLQMPNRTNVDIISSARSVGERGAILVVPGLRPVGPLTLPVR